MKKRIAMICTAALFVIALARCSTVGGTVVGAGIGAMAGDAELGAAVGMTAGAVQDIFGR